MDARRLRPHRRLVAVACLSAIAFVACGSDEDSSGAKDTETRTSSTTAETRPPVAPEFEEYCDVAWKIWEQDSPPKPGQLRTAVEIAPEDISAAANTAAGPLIAAGDDMVAFFNAFAADEVELAVDEINAWESDNCKIPHDPSGPGEGATREIDPAATRRDVTMLEYSFDFDEPVSAGPTSFVLNNDGAQAHFLLLVRLADGVSLQEAMENDGGDSSIEAEWTSGLAAGGSAEEEVLTVDLQPGTYGMLCFVSDPDGTPHAMKGMTREFTVAAS